jgi:glutamate--cysteine ligase
MDGAIGQLDHGLLARSQFMERIKARQQEIHAWLKAKESSHELPLYSSVDIRDAGFKISVVDTNLFPAGFNNLCEHGIDDAVGFVKTAVLRRVPNCKNILIVSEEHTRNTWYLENIRILEQIISRAGFNVKIASFLTTQPDFCQDNMKFIQLQTATDQPVQIHCFQTILNEIKAGHVSYDLIILNNDLMTGIPEILKNTGIPIYPSLMAGWHSRLKSHHFCHASDLLREFSQLIGMDPWFFSSFYAVVAGVDINDDRDRAELTESARQLFQQIEAKYKEHRINEKPFIFLKADAGTYGMGVLPIESPDDIHKMNRKNRNRLYKGKGSQVITRYLLQEGVPTIVNVDREVSEVCIYQIENNLIGGFYRSHAFKGTRDNLNTQGMEFKKMCPHLRKYGDCGVHHDLNIFDIYRILARIAGIAAHREISQLENDVRDICRD